MSVTRAKRLMTRNASWWHLALKPCMARWSWGKVGNQNILLWCQNRFLKDFRRGHDPIESQSSGIKHRRPQDDPAAASVFAQFVQSHLCNLFCATSVRYVKQYNYCVCLVLLVAKWKLLGRRKKITADTSFQSNKLQIVLRFASNRAVFSFTQIKPGKKIATELIIIVPLFVFNFCWALTFVSICALIVFMYFT